MQIERLYGPSRRRHGRRPSRRPRPARRSPRPLQGHGRRRPVSPAELARRTGTSERYVREWLNANAASGYVTYDAASATYTLPPEQALALAVEQSPAFIPGAFQIISACFHDADRVEGAFRTGAGMGWHEHHHHDLFHGTERFFRPGCLVNLTTSWIPALEGVETKLQ